MKINEVKVRIYQSKRFKKGFQYICMWTTFVQHIFIDFKPHSVGTVMKLLNVQLKV